MRRLLGPIRVRLALLVLIAAIPLLMLAGTIAWQNYRLALATTEDTAIRLRESAVARHVSAVEAVEQLLQALAQAAELTGTDPRTCHMRLAGVLALQAERYSNIVVVEPDGRLRCSARDIPPDAAGPLGPNAAANAELFARAAERQGFVLGPIRVSRLSGREIIPAVYPLLKDGRALGYMFAGLRIDWFARPPDAPTPELRALWVVDGKGRAAQVEAEDAPGLPDGRALMALEAGPSVLMARSPGGTPYAYASGRLGEGYDLIVATPANADRQAASGLLVTRIGQLGLLLLVGLAAVAIGTHLALVEPLAQLSHAVARWRSEGTFDASALRDPPTEIREMAATFAEATRSVADHEAQLKVAAAQQELLTREVHHRVKNNLQIVASLLNLQASRIRQPEARAEFASARDRVRALATLHRHLYTQGEVHAIDMPSFLSELCNQLFQAMGEVPGRRIGLAIEASPLQMSSDQAVPLSLIVTEVVSNAVKYAFPDGRAGQVSVRLTTTDGDMADLVIADDGVGLRDSSAGNGIGKTLIRGFARQLGATLAVHEEGGTRYVLRLPLNPVAVAA